jgi:hypothetical protein
MGMTRPEVVGVMGPPRRVAAKQTDKGIRERLYWWSPSLIGFTFIDNEALSGDRVFVALLDGKTVEWGDRYQFEPSDAIQDSINMTKEIMKSARPAQK